MAAVTALKADVDWAFKFASIMMKQSALELQFQQAFAQLNAPAPHAPAPPPPPPPPPRNPIIQFQLPSNLSPDEQIRLAMKIGRRYTDECNAYEALFPGAPRAGQLVFEIGDDNAAPEGAARKNRARRRR